MLMVEKIAAVERKEEEEEEDLLDLDEEAREKLNKVVATLRRGSVLAK